MSEKIPTQNESLVQFPEYSAELNEMGRVDQDVRERAVRGEDLDVRSLDLRNSIRLKEIIDEIGWPSATKVGKDASHNAWLLAQHDDHDVAFQETCLALMKQEPAGQVDLKDVAMLEDRIRVNKGMPQIYGTQFRDYVTDSATGEVYSIGEHRPYIGIEDAERVNQRRAEMGLESLEENIRGMYKQYGAPPQG